MTVLTIDESTASLNRVAFISTVQVSVQNSTAYLNLSEQCPTDSLLPDRATIMLSQKVSQRSRKVCLWETICRIIESCDSNTTIVYTTFAENSVAT